MQVRPGTRSDSTKPSSDYLLSWNAGSQRVMFVSLFSVGAAGTQLNDPGVSAFGRHGMKSWGLLRTDPATAAPSWRTLSPTGPPGATSCCPQLMPGSARWASSTSEDPGPCWALPPLPACWLRVLRQEPQVQGRKVSHSGPRPSLCRGGFGRAGPEHFTTRGGES